MSISPQGELVVQLSNLRNLLLKRIEHQLSMHGISYTEFLVLSYLFKATNNRMRRIELAEIVGLSASGITRLLLPMEKIGLVEKESNPRDARVSLVKLTSAGKRVYTDAEMSFNFGAEAATKQLSPKRQDTLKELISKLS